MKAIYKNQIVNIIPIEEEKGRNNFLIEKNKKDRVLTDMFWFSLNYLGTYDYQGWKKRNRVIGDLKEGKIYSWVGKTELQFLPDLIMETE